MLLRGANAVGYASYPDNVIREFVREAYAEGIDIFRIFDSLNSIENMRVSIDAVLETGAVCEAAICYTGDILDQSAAEIFAEVLCRAGEATGKTGRAFSGDQGHGRLVQAVCGIRAGEDAEGRNRRCRFIFTPTIRAASTRRRF